MNRLQARERARGRAAKWLVWVLALTLAVFALPATDAWAANHDVDAASLNGGGSIPSYAAGDTITITGGNSLDSTGFNRLKALTTTFRLVLNGVTKTIPFEAFRDCTGLTSVTMPDGVETIKMSAFRGCTNLTSVAIPGSVTTIEINAFQDCTSLTSVAIPDGVTTIAMDVFRDCTGLKSVTIPGSVETIETSAFMGCTGLTGVEIPVGVTAIGQSAFQDCTGLTSVTMPNSLRTIGVGAFQGCSGLVSASFPAAISMGQAAFEGCAKLVSVNFPVATGVEASAFKNCASLVSVSFPMAQSVGLSAFENCAKLVSVSFPAATVIGPGAFKDCTSLVSVRLPAVTSIEEWAFQIEYDSSPGVLSLMELGGWQITFGEFRFFNRANPILLLVPTGQVSNYAGIIGNFPTGSKVLGKGATTAGPVILAPGAQLTLDSGLAGVSGVAGFQWKKDGVNIPGATSAAYTKTAAAGDGGLYEMSFTYDLDASGAIEANETFTLAAIRVVVGTAPLIGGEAAKTGSQTVVGGSLVTPASFAVAGEPAPNVLLGGAPSGVTFDYSAGTITIGGTPTQAGTFTLAATAQNEITEYKGELATLTYTLTVDPVAPVITNATTTLSVKQGATGTLQVTATGVSAPAFSATLENGDPLPAWITIDPTSGAITAKPGASQATGDIVITVTATNSAGSDTKDFTITVTQASSGGNPGDPGGGTTPSSSTTPAGVSVTIGDEKINAEKQPDGTWLITVPAGTDISNLTIAGTLPTGASSSPRLPVTHNFNDGPLAITVTAQDGKTKKTYTIEVLVEEPAGPIERALFTIDAADCEIVITQNDDGTLAVKVRIPFARAEDAALLATVRMIAGGLGLTDVSYNIVNADGSETPVTPLQSARGATAPYLEIGGTAANMEAVKDGAITKIEYTLKGEGTQYVQKFPGAGLKVSTMPGYPSPEPTPTGGGSSGCDAGAAGVLAVALCGAYLWRKQS